MLCEVRDMVRLRIAPEPAKAVVKAVEVLSRWIDPEHLRLGGGTALEARWHHRDSTDLDFFVLGRQEGTTMTDDITIHEYPCYDICADDTFDSAHANRRFGFAYPTTLEEQIHRPLSVSGQIGAYMAGGALPVGRPHDRASTRHRRHP